MQRIWPLPKIVFSPLSAWNDSRSISVVTTEAAWHAVESRWRLPVENEILAVVAEAASWDALLSEVRGEVLYAVGGGLAADAAKYLGARTQRPVVSVPTALSVDAFFTPAAGVRENGCVRYIETGPPELAVVDWELIGHAPGALRAAGICDVLSIATARWDWRFAHQQQRLDEAHRMIAFADHAAEAIMLGALQCAELAGRGEPEGLKQLLDCLCLEVQLCNQLGHSRPEEGSEHYFAYAVENHVSKGMPHGNLVGPGILLMAEAQGQSIGTLRHALEECQVPLNTIPREMIERTLRELPEYARTHQLPEGMAHHLNEGAIGRLLDAYPF